MSLSNTSKALLLTIYEYLSVTVPVGLFIALEAAHEKQWRILWSSPKWAVAIIFLLFQGLSLYVRFLNRSGGKVSPTAIGALGLLALIIIIGTVVNVWNALDPEENSKLSITVRVALLTLVSVIFCMLVWSARFYQMRRGMLDGQKV